MCCSFLRIWFSGRTGAGRTSEDCRFHRRSTGFFRLSPLRKQKKIHHIWRVLYPCGIHFFFSQLVGYVGLWLLARYGEGGGNLYYNNAILLTGITGILTIIPCLYFFRKDRIARIAGGLIPEENSAWKLRFSEGVLVLLMGAAFSQFANMLVALLQTTLNYQEYQESMDQMISGKSLWFLILCMGVIAPIAEEIVFRWLIYLRLRDYMSMGLATVISGVFFGVYHGNLVQAVYAGILGIVFARFLEMTGDLKTSILLHMGANIWSLLYSYLISWALKKVFFGGMVMLLVLGLLLVMILGTRYFRKRAEGMKNRVI